ncbi:MAG: hypothetical protein EBS38_04860 [Actinobacteria bacterium]|nr:hypothetical protein [Actinomycetota bacterium]
MKRLALLATSLLLLTGCAPAPELAVKDAYLIRGECEGIEVVVNFGILGKRQATCVEATGEVNAKELLADAGFLTEGTKSYGDQIVCRVNGLPSATEAIEVEGQEPHLESCNDMPPAFAYWALWVKADAEAKWNYATEGVGTLNLKPGQSIGLAFSTGGATPTPN